MTAFVSRHNSEQDEIDDDRFEELAEKIRSLAADPRYADISLSVDSW